MPDNGYLCFCDVPGLSGHLSFTDVKLYTLTFVSPILLDACFQQSLPSIFHILVLGFGLLLCFLACLYMYLS